MSTDLINTKVNSGCASVWWSSKLVGPMGLAFVIRISILTALLIRVGPGALVRNDTNSYLVPGLNLLLHGSFQNQGLPELLRTPGYSLFLAISSLASLPVAAITNVILSVFSVLLVWKLGQALTGNDRAALTAAWLFAVEPVSSTFSVVLLSETLFLTLLLLSLHPLVMFLHERRLPQLAASGLWLTAAIFVRPVAYYLPFAFALGLFLVFARVPGIRALSKEPHHRSSGLLWKAPAVLLLSILPWLSMWQIRNFVETGYSGFSSAKDEDLYFLDAAGVLARVQHRDFDDEWKELGISKLDLRSATSFYNLPSYIAAHPEQAGWSQGQRLTFIRSAAINIIREHWPVYLVSCSSSLKKIILDNGADHLVNILKVMKTETDTAIKQNAPVSEGRVSRWTQFVNRHPGTYLLHLLLNAVFTIIMSGLYLFAARGLFFLARGTFRGDYPIAYLGLILGTLFYFLTVTALAAGPIVSARYRLPIMPFVCILAAVGLQFSKARSASLK